jgi:DNA-binding CsgD family transcriptional regulator
VIPQDFLEHLAAERGLSKSELKALSLAVNGQQIPAIAISLNTSEDAIRKRLSEIYHKFQIPGRGPVKMAQLQQLLLTRYQESIPHTNVEKSAGSIAHSPRDWGDAPDASAFYGRTTELETLQQWIIQDSSRLVALCGMGGIGKTALAVKFSQLNEKDFQFLMWRSLRNAPPLENLLSDCFASLFDLQETDLPKNIDEKISKLIEFLQKCRCLLVLDSAETIVREGDILGRYKQGYEGYGGFLRKIGETQHQSCLLLISQEKLREVSLLENLSPAIHSLQLGSLNPEAAREILQSKGLTGEQQWEKLIRMYRGNPLALKLIAGTIENIFNKNVEGYLKWGTISISHDYREILDNQFQRLSDFEITLMQAIAKEEQAISFQKLRSGLTPEFSVSDLIEGLESLGRRSLIEKVVNNNANGFLFDLQPAIRKYIKNFKMPNFASDRETI